MIFRLINPTENRQTHAGVLEFVAEEGRAYFPQWVNNNFYDKRMIYRIHTTTDDGDAASGTK